jgi:hypothetical protein
MCGRITRMSEDKPNPPRKAGEPLSLHCMTPEDAIQRAFGTKPTEKADQGHGEGTILFHRYGMQLRIGENDSLILNVLCGRVGMYAVEFTLNDNERERYKHEGDSYLNELEVRVMADPQAFIKRGRVC